MCLNVLWMTDLFFELTDFLRVGVDYHSTPPMQRCKYYLQPTYNSNWSLLITLIRWHTTLCDAWHDLNVCLAKPDKSQHLNHKAFLCSLFPPPYPICLIITIYLIVHPQTHACRPLILSGIYPYLHRYHHFYPENGSKLEYHFNSYGLRLNILCMCWPLSRCG